VLNVPKNVEVAAGARFFEEINKPFLEAAIKRGDDITLATIPKFPQHLIDPITGDLIGNFAKEIHYIVRAGIKPSNVSASQWYIIQGWFK
jgi:hypothetical protein